MKCLQLGVTASVALYVLTGCSEGDSTPKLMPPSSSQAPIGVLPPSTSNAGRPDQTGPCAKFDTSSSEYADCQGSEKLKKLEPVPGAEAYMDPLSNPYVTPKVIG